MMLLTNNLLFIISSALLASGHLVERGYTPPVGINYCQDLVSHLNSRYNARILSEKCTGSHESGSGGIELLDPAELRCHDLVDLVRERGVLVDIRVCPIDEREERMNALTSDAMRDDYEHHCRRVVERLRLFEAKVHPEVCHRLARGDDGKGGDELRRTDYTKLSCGKLVRLARKIGIPVSSVICRNPARGDDNDFALINLDDIDHSGDRDSRPSENQTCPNIVARLQVLGINVNVDVCLGLEVHRRLSRSDVDRMRCRDVAAYAKVLGIISVDVNVCLRREPHSENRILRREESDSRCKLIQDQLVSEGILRNSYTCSDDQGASDLFDSLNLSHRGDQDYCDKIKEKVNEYGIPVKLVICLGKPVIIV
ncbi:hypothetical protein K7432_016416 [Basidiobolus ranarum]|uniref:Uncharacterized protein n=1 Tax=Basidiobolus ranarum TaxID=34480 RepID=A0ABR2VLL8_9FUNG